MRAGYLRSAEPRTRIVFGVDSVNQVGALAREIGARKVLLVTDPGIVTAGHADLVQKHLAAANIEFAVFDRVRENPSSACVNDCLASAKAAGIDAIIGLGGGSSDAASTLLGLARLWKLKISDDELRSLALELGSDVPYFLKPGSAHATGCNQFGKTLTG